MSKEQGPAKNENILKNDKTESGEDIVAQIRDFKAKNPGVVEKGFKSKESRDYWKKINEIVQLVKQGGGITKVVIHGNPIFDTAANFEKLHGEKGWGKGYKAPEEQQFIESGPPIEINNDFDTKGALLLLSELAETNPEFFAEGAITEIIPKGTNETFTKTKFTEKGQQVERKAEMILYLDVGNKNISVEIIKENGQENAHIYADHHGEEGGYETSATQIVYDVGKAGGMFKEGKKISKAKLEFYGKMVRCINKVDNLNFIDDLNENDKEKGKDRLVDIPYLKEEFPRSLYSLAKFLPFETTLEILGKLDKDGKFVTEKYLTKNKKTRSWGYTFSENEIQKGEIGKMKIMHNGKEITLKQLIEENRKEIGDTIESEQKILKYMQENGIKTTSPLVGKLIYRNYFKTEKTDRKGKTYKEKTPFVKDNIAYLVARGLGADSFVSYSGTDGKIFINSSGQFDLMKVWRKLNKIVPGYPKPVRNRFLFPPKDPAMLALIKEKISEEKFLEILEIKDGESAEIKKVKPEKKPQPVAIEETEKVKNNENKTAHINTDEGAEDEDSLAPEVKTEEKEIHKTKNTEIEKKAIEPNNENKPKTKKERKEENKKRKTVETLEQKTTFEAELDDEKIQTLAEKISSGEKLSPEDAAIKEKIGEIIPGLKANKEKEEFSIVEEVRSKIIQNLEENTKEEKVELSKKEEKINELLERKKEIEKRLQEIEDEKFGVRTFRKRKNWLQKTWRKIFNF